MGKRGTHPLQRTMPGTPPAGAGSRYVKCVCTRCGFTARITRRWIAEGLPTCHCGGAICEVGHYYSPEELRRLRLDEATAKRAAGRKAVRDGE